MTEELPDQDRQCRDPRLDSRAIVRGGILSAVLAVGLATLFLTAAQSDRSPDVGPTAATFGDASATLSGSVLGVLIGAAVAAAMARTGSRIVTGVLANWLAYSLVLLPITVATGESFAFGLVLAVPLGLAGFVGAAIGAAIGDGRGSGTPRADDDRSPHAPHPSQERRRSESFAPEGGAIRRQGCRLPT